MLVEVRARSQITLPSELVKDMSVTEGDKFEVVKRDGGIFLCPVVVYSKPKLKEIAKTIKEHESDPAAVYDSVEDMFKDMGINLVDDDV